MQKLIAKLKSLLDEFKTFAIRGNVIDLAVGIVIGGAFTALVNGVVKGVITPIIAIMTLQENAGWSTIYKGLWSFGTGVFEFILLAAVVFFVFVKPVNKLRSMMAQEEPKPAEPPPPTNEERLLAEIRDLLKNQEEKNEAKPPTRRGIFE